LGQKVNPIGLRLGIVKTWDSNWFDEKNFAEKLKEDFMLRRYVHKRLRQASIAKVTIERTARRVSLTIHTARPGLVIGKKGQEVDKLREELKHITNKDVQLNIKEIKRPELNAQLVADNIARQIEGKAAFRRVMKKALQQTMKMGAEGIKILMSGRLGGAEMARSEGYKDGRTPLHTLRADIDYATSTAKTAYGAIGVKVWISNGEIIGRNQ
jgi:small subunit ribosomal protein S3